MAWAREILVAAVLAAKGDAAESQHLSPTALAALPERNVIYVAYATANRVEALDLTAGTVTGWVDLPASPSGLVASKERLYVACAAAMSSVAVVAVKDNRIVATIPIGHTAMAPVLHPSGKTLYVCNRFNNDISVIDLTALREIKRVPVGREPVAASITPDGKYLFVANHLHHGCANAQKVASTVSVVDTACAKTVTEIVLPNGSGLLRGISVSPDGKYVAVTHLLSRFQLPTTQVERGWINNNALTLISVEDLKVINTVLLDEVDRGAANPWDCAWSNDGKFIVVTHAGTHEVSIIDAHGLLARLASMATKTEPGATVQYAHPFTEPRASASASRVAADVPNDLSFIVGLRQRVALREHDRGPRALSIVGSRVFVANYFSDTLSVVNLASQRATSIKLSQCIDPGLARKGEFYFNDATICFQGWQSCASCHSSDGRVDGLNWDNLNDGIGNPKNVKSLLLAHATPPSMWLGVRSNAAVAVRAGIKNSLFTIQRHEVADALDAFLASLQEVPSPYLQQSRDRQGASDHGKLSSSALRGQRLFVGEAGCAECHPKSLYTDLKAHNVGTCGASDQPTDRFDTPSLVEAWRTAPYLHDGSAATVRDVLTTRNPTQTHGNVQNLTQQELSDLIEFVLSL